MFRSIRHTALLLTLLLGGMMNYAYAETYNGNCGPTGNETDITWSLNTEDSTLTITGSGAMADWTTTADVPWYEYRKFIKHVVIGEGVTTIGGYAFYQCQNLVSVSNPSTLRQIRRLVCYRCHALETFNFPEGLEAIGTNIYSHGPFYECTALKAIYIPSTVDTIYRDAFLRCSGATSIVVATDNPKYDSRDNCNAIIHTATKRLCYGCQTTVIPNGVETVSEFAFEYQHNLQSIRIAKTVTAFGNGVFKECENLRDVYVEWTAADEIPNWNNFTNWLEHSDFDEKQITLHVPCGCKSVYTGLTANNKKGWRNYTIKDDHNTGGICGAQGSNLTWMLNCDSVLTISGTGEMMNWSSASKVPWYTVKEAIKEVVINNGVTNIGRNAFNACPKLTTITIPPTVTNIGMNAFANCSKLDNLHISDLAAWCDVNFYDETACPFMQNGWLTPSKVGNLYLNGSLVTTLTIPDGVTTIMRYAFYGICSFTSIQFNQVMTIGEYAFAACHGLESLNMPSTLTTISNNTFPYCLELKTAIISDNMTTLPQFSFYNCPNLKSVTIPASVTDIGVSVFESCSGLTDIYVEWTGAIPNWPTKFTDKSPQSDITLHVPCGTKSLYEANTSGWQNYTIEDHLISGTCGATGHESDVTWSFCMTDSVLTISGTGAMKDWTTSTTIPWDSYKSSIKTVVINDGVTNIGGYAFYNCNNLTSVSIPNTVTTIGKHALRSSQNLLSLTIPNSVTTIGSPAFGRHLQDLYVSWTGTDILTYNQQIVTTNPGVTLHVPCGTEQDYIDKGWDEKCTIEERGGTYNVTVETETGDNSQGGVSIRVLP